MDTHHCERRSDLCPSDCAAGNYKRPMAPRMPNVWARGPSLTNAATGQCSASLTSRSDLETETRWTRQPRVGAQAPQVPGRRSPNLSGGTGTLRVRVACVSLGVGRTAAPRESLCQYKVKSLP